MKKSGLLLSLTVFSWITSACDPGNDREDNSVTVAPEPDSGLQPGNGHDPVVSFSHSGNTGAMGAETRKRSDARWIKTDPADIYPAGYDATLTRVRQKIAAIDGNGVSPDVRTAIDSFDEYDGVFVCPSLRYARMATPTQSFLHPHIRKSGGKRPTLAITGSNSSRISPVIADRHRSYSESTFTGEASWIKVADRKRFRLIAGGLKTPDLSQEPLRMPETGTPSSHETQPSTLPLR